jgi:hypothetical protein
VRGAIFEVHSSIFSSSFTAKITAKKGGTLSVIHDSTQSRNVEFPSIASGRWHSNGAPDARPPGCRLTLTATLADTDRAMILRTVTVRAGRGPSTAVSLVP